MGWERNSSVPICPPRQKLFRKIFRILCARFLQSWIPIILGIISGATRRSLGILRSKSESSHAKPTERFQVARTLQARTLHDSTGGPGGDAMR